MANQTEQLARLLRDDGWRVDVVRTNAPYRPAWTGRMPVVRAFARLLPYLASLWRCIRDGDVVHVMANSGWAWHLFAAPAIWVAALQRKPVLVNYRGGEADRFLATRPWLFARTMRAVDALVVPSGFLHKVFADHGHGARVIPNIVDLTRFRWRDRGEDAAPVVLVARNLEAIYDVATAIRAFARLHAQRPAARLVIAGDGPERAALEEMTRAAGLAAAVEFTGRLAGADMAALYARATLLLNSSVVDNMPNALLEAMASGLPIVTTDAGGIPYLVEHDRTALLAPMRDHEGLAAAMLRVLGDRALFRHLAANARAEAESFQWAVVKQHWEGLYRELAQPRQSGNPP